MAKDQIIVLSAKTEKQLYVLVEQLIDTLKSGDFTEKDFNNICYTLQIGREHMEARMAVVANSLEKALEMLVDFNRDKSSDDNIWINTENELIFVPNGSEREFDELFRSLVKNNKFGQIAELWVKGFDFNWEEIYDYNKSLHCVSLPMYPFNDERYWLRDKYVFSDTSEYEIMVFNEQWVSAELTSHLNVNIENVLVILSDGIDEQMVRYSIKAQNVYFIRNNDNYESKLAEIKKKIPKLKAIWYINDRVDEKIIQNCALLVKAIYSTEIKVEKVLVFGVYSNAVEKATLDACVAYERSLKFIIPNTNFNIIFTKQNNYNIPEIIEILKNELGNQKNQSVWYDGKTRKVTFVSSEIISEKKSSLKKNGVYCIIGGMGGLGKIFAKWFITKYHSKLILVGRSALNIEKFNKIKGNYDYIEYIQADVNDIESLKNAFDYIENKYGSIDGIVDAAGLVGGTSITEKSIEEFNHILEPNINGTMNIEKAVEGRNIGFIAYFCSNATILGDLGSCCYSVGKRFQQSYINGLDSSLNRLILNWPLWKSDGMNFDDERVNDFYMKSSGQKLMDSRGIELLDKLLGQKNRQHLIFYAKKEKAYNIIRALNAEKIAVHSDRVHSTNVVKKVKKLDNKDIDTDKLFEDDVKQIIFELIGLKKEEITGKMNFADIGFSSIELEDFVSKMNEMYGLSLSPDVFFNYPTVGTLVKFIVQKYSDKIDEFYKKEEEYIEVKQEETEVEDLSEEEFIESNPQNEVTEICDNSLQREKISIIGMSGRFPDSRNTDDLWKILKDGKDVTREVINEREGWAEYRQNHENDPMNGKRKIGAVPGIFEFDPLFFSISPADAEKTDPRQRLLLEEVWKALEDAGYDRELLDSERMGVFVGAEESDYPLNVENKGITSNTMSALAGRIGYFFDLKGPNMVIDTACSSSLVALCQACLNIEAGICDSAIVAGVSILSTSSDYKLMEKSKIISPDGMCRAFDTKANGMVPAESVSVIVIKKENKARSDGHSIYANILGYGINYDGKTNGFTAPSGNSQRDLIKNVYDRFNINKGNIGLIVLHGTGTRLGDSIEINSLSEAFADDSNVNHCAVVSFKPNLGHALAASGLVSLTGLILSMKNKKLPPSINCDSLNKYINWEESPFYLNTELHDWYTENNRLRCAGVSGFGITGTNAHVVIEDENMYVPSLAINTEYKMMFVFTAKSLQALKKNIAVMKEYILNSDENLESICYTLSKGRMHLQYRCVIIADTKDLLINKMTSFINDIQTDDCFAAKVPNEFEKNEAVVEEIYSLDENVSLEKASEFFIEGYDEICSVVFKNFKKMRLHMPTYEFDNKEYYIKKNGETQTSRNSFERVSSDLDKITLKTVIFDDEFEK